MHNLLPNLVLHLHVGLLVDDTHPDQQTPVLQHMAAMDQTRKRPSRMLESVPEHARLGRATLHPVAVPLSTLVHAAVPHAQATAPDRQVECVPPANWPVVGGDETLLGRRGTD